MGRSWPRPSIYRRTEVSSGQPSVIRNPHRPYGDILGSKYNLGLVLARNREDVFISTIPPKKLLQFLRDVSRSIAYPAHKESLVTHTGTFSEANTTLPSASSPAGDQEAVAVVFGVWNVTVCRQEVLLVVTEAFRFWTR